MNRLGLAFAGLMTLTGAAPASSPDPRDLTIPAGDIARARSLVARLASADFNERERAQESLTEMGRRALPALLDGLNTHPSPEVRFRCQAMVPRASAAELQARLTTFLADTGGKFDHDLPGWNEFQKIAGKTAAARTVFVELLKDPDNRELLLAMGGPEAELGNLIGARKQELYTRRYQRLPGVPARQPTVPEVMALVFAETRVATKLVPRSISISVLMSTPAVRDAVLDSSEKGKVYKSVVVHWLNSRDDASSIYQAISIASNLNLKDAAGIALKLMAMNTATPYYRAQAALTIVKLEAREHLPAIEKLLDDEQVMITIRMANNAEPIQIQLRDSALASCLMLTGQNPEDYGFVSRYKSSGAALRYNYSNWYLTPDKRKAAIDKWKDWRSKNPEFEKGKSK